MRRSRRPRDRKSTRLNSSHTATSRMPSSARKKKKQTIIIATAQPRLVLFENRNFVCSSLEIFFFNDAATTEIYTLLYLFPYTTLFRSGQRARQIPHGAVHAHREGRLREPR